MKKSDFYRAIEILTMHHSNEVVINKSTGHGSTTGNQENPTLHIKSCCASVTSSLVTEGYSLHVKDGFMSVEKYL